MCAIGIGYSQRILYWRLRAGDSETINHGMIGVSEDATGKVETGEKVSI